MSKWDKITLYKFQQIDDYNNRTDLDDTDKTLWSICVVFDYTEFQVNEMSADRVNKLAAKIAAIFTAPFNPHPDDRLGRWVVDYDANKWTFGQYIELAFWLSGGSPLKAAHRILASVTHLPYRRNRSDRHRVKSDWFLTQPIEDVIGCVGLVVERFQAFNKEFASLFGLDKEVAGDVQTDPFNKRYGWTYSATKVAEYERISLNEAYKIPARVALNDLAYLKALGKYESEQLKKSNNGR